MGRHSSQTASPIGGEVIRGLSTTSFKMKNKAIILAAVFGLAAGSSSAAPLPKNLLHAINMVEASGRTNNVPAGDHGKAIGPFQIHEKYWQDAVGYDKSIGGSYRNCQDYAYSVKVVTAYCNKYAKEAVASGDLRVLALTHHSAFSYDEKYWLKVKKFLK